MPAFPSSPGRAHLLDQLVAAMSSPSGRIVVFGEPGIGKSTLMAAAAERVRAEGGVRVLHVRASRHHTARPYLGLHDLLRNIDLDRFPIEECHRVVLDAALGAQPNTADGTDLGIAFDALLTSMSAERPVAVAVDEIGFIDEETHDVLQYASLRSDQSGHRAAFVATQTVDPLATTETTGFAPGVCNPSDAVPIPAMSREELWEVIVATPSGAGITQDEFDVVYDRSGGNPLWAFELLLQAASGQRISHVPGSLNEVLTKRVGALSAAARQVLVSVALMDHPTRRSLATVFGLGAEEVDDAIEAGVVVDDRGSLTPSHHLLAGAALDAVPSATVRGLHATIARHTSDLVARADHLDRAAEKGTDEMIATLLHDAAWLERRRGARTTATRLLRRAVDRTPDHSSSRDGRQVMLAELLLSGGALEECISILENLDLAALPVEYLDRALPVLLMAESALRGEEAAAERLTLLGDVLRADRLRHAIALIYQSEVSSDPFERERSAQHGLDILRGANAAPVSRHRAIGSIVGAKLDTARGLDRGLLAEASRIEQELDLVSLSDSADAQRAFFAYQTGDFETSIGALGRMREKASAQGETLVRGLLTVHLATANVLMGHRASAERNLQEWDDLGAFADSPPPSVVVAKGLLLLRDLDEEPLHALLGTPHGHGSERIGALARAALWGLNAARRDRMPEALRELERAVEIAESVGITEPGRRLWIDFALARIYILVGKTDLAAAIARRLRSIAGSDRRVLLGVALRIEGILADLDGDHDRALTLLQQSVADLVSVSLPTELALSLLELGRHYQSVRARTEATEAFERATEVARMAGDLQLMRVIETVSARSEPTHLPEVLSEREHAVALAAARGKSNKEIALEHFISVRTVETQLSAAYRKLGVRSRSELSALLSPSTAV